MNSLRFLAASLSLGAIGFYGSEALFWTAPPAGLPALQVATQALLTMFVYALCAAVGLSAMLASGCGGWRGAILGGALMGISVEGAVVSTMYDAFPVQLVWTPLAWHSLLTAGVVFAASRWAAAGPLWRHGLVLSLAGLGFGFWGGYWVSERPELALAGPLPSLAYLGGAAVMAVAAQIALDRLHPLPVPPRPLLWAAPVLVLLLWLVQSALAPAPQRLAGPVMALATAWAMMRLGRGQSASLGPAAPARRHALAMALPLIAAPVAAALWSSEEPIPTNLIVLAITAPAGLGLWLWLLWRAYRSAASAPPRSSAPS